MTGRKVISVLSADGKQPLVMLHTIPNQLMQAPQNAEVRFNETPANMPPTSLAIGAPIRTLEIACVGLAGVVVEGDHSAEDVWVLDPTPVSMLTLINGYPFAYLGPAPRRFVVRADRIL